MTDPKIVASAKNLERGRPVRAPESSGAWAALGWIGLVFLVVGGSDFVLTWIPTDFGNPEWEFGTVTASFDGLPVLVLGLGLLLVASQQLERRWWGTLGVAVAVVLLIWVLVGFALWAMNLSLALQTVPDELALGLRRAVAKTLVQSIAFEALLAYLIWQRWAGREQGAGQGEAG